MMRSLSRRRNERHIASKHGFGPADEQATRDGDPHSPGHDHSGHEEKVGLPTTGRMLGVTLWMQNVTVAKGEGQMTRDCGADVRHPAVRRLGQTPQTQPGADRCPVAIGPADL